VSDGFSRPIEAQMEDEAVAIVRVVGSEDANEGCRAFREKRRPQYRGR
jgi:enoyl-CoA hydratase/carnithine racemase